MNNHEARRWAYTVAAEFIRNSWDKCDWDEKVGPDAERLDEAILDLASSLARRGTNPGDRKPRGAA